MKTYLFSVLLLTNIQLSWCQKKPSAEYDKFKYMLRDLSRDIVSIKYADVSALDDDPILIKMGGQISETSVARPSEIVFTHNRKIKISWLSSGDKESTTIFEKGEIIRDYTFYHNLIIISEPNKSDKTMPFICEECPPYDASRKPLPNYDYRLEILSWQEYFEPKKLVTPAIR